MVTLLLWGRLYDCSCCKDEETEGSGAISWQIQGLGKGRAKIWTQESLTLNCEILTIFRYCLYWEKLSHCSLCSNISGMNWFNTVFSCAQLQILATDSCSASSFSKTIKKAMRPDCVGGEVRCSDQRNKDCHLAFSSSGEPFHAKAVVICCLFLPCSILFLPPSGAVR